MPDKHPYAMTPGAIAPVLSHFKKSLPNKIDSQTIKKLGYAANTEYQIINIIKFLGLIDEQNSPTEKAKELFLIHNEGEFQSKFSEVIKEVYDDLFSLHGDSTWELDNDKLITFFRQTNQSTERIGKEQARTFRILCAYAGREAGSISVKKSGNSSRKKPLAPSGRISTASSNQNLPPSSPSPSPAPSREVVSPNIGFNIRIEINLPVAEDQGVYDRIFKSIKENLLNG